MDHGNMSSQWDFLVDDQLYPTPQQEPISTDSTTVPCTTCRKRKVRCDRNRPCQNCHQLGYECLYEVRSQSGPSASRRQAMQTSKISALTARIASLEALVMNMSESAKAAPLPDQISPVPSTEALDPINSLFRNILSNVKNEGSVADDADARAGKLVFSQTSSRYVLSSFWAAQHEEIGSLAFLLHVSTSPSSSLGRHLTPVDVLEAKIGIPHPPKARSDYLCRVYMTNVDPFVRIVHKPRFFLDLNNYRRETMEHRSEFEALLCAIYAMAVLSMSEEEVFSRMHASKEHLLQQRQSATETALERCGYLQSDEIISLQALVLHITLLFERNKHIEASTLLGTAFRIAQRIGLQRDGAHFALSPWRVEMRRRIWLYLCVLDVRAMETLGAEPLMGELESDTRMIRNCNDLSWDACEFSKLWPNPSDGFTEMTYSLVEAELSSLLRVVLFRAGKALLTLDSYTKVLNQLIEQVRERIDVLYLKNLDMAEPLQRLISAMASACISKAELITQQYIYRCRKITGAVVNEQRDRLFLAAIEFCERWRALEADATPHGWGWLFRASTQWHPVAIVLANLTTQLTGPVVVRAWSVIDAVFERHDEADPLWAPLQKMRQEAVLRHQEYRETPQMELDVDLSRPSLPLLDDTLDADWDSYIPLDIPAYQQWPLV